MRAADTIWRPAHCQWIADTPTGDDGCKCLMPVQDGSAYCPTHHAMSRRREGRSEPEDKRPDKAP